MNHLYLFFFIIFNFNYAWSNKDIDSKSKKDILDNCQMKSRIEREKDLSSQDLIDIISSSVRLDRLFKFTSQRSKLIACQIDGEVTQLDFVNGDRITYNRNLVAPESLVNWVGGIEKIEAERLLKTILKKIGGKKCQVDWKSPTESRKESSQQINTFWCQDNAAVSIWISADSRAHRLRAWFIH